MTLGETTDGACQDRAEATYQVCRSAWVCGDWRHTPKQINKLDTCQFERRRWRLKKRPNGVKSTPEQEGNPEDNGTKAIPSYRARLALPNQTERSGGINASRDGFGHQFFVESIATGLDAEGPFGLKKGRASR